MTEQQFGDLLWLKSPIVDWTSEPWGRSTPHSAPAMPPWGSPSWGEIVDVLKGNNDLADAVEHELDPASAAPPYARPDGTDEPDTSEDSDLCQWDGEPFNSIHPLGRWNDQMMVHYATHNPAWAAY